MYIYVCKVVKVTCQRCKLSQQHSYFVVEMACECLVFLVCFEHSFQYSCVHSCHMQLLLLMLKFKCLSEMCLKQAPQYNHSLDLLRVSREFLVQECKFTQILISNFLCNLCLFGENIVNLNFMLKIANLCSCHRLTVVKIFTLCLLAVHASSYCIWFNVHSDIFSFVSRVFFCKVKPYFENGCSALLEAFVHFTEIFLTAWARVLEHRFLADCSKMRLNQHSFVFLNFAYFVFLSCIQFVYFL